MGLSGEWVRRAKVKISVGNPWFFFNKQWTMANVGLVKISFPLV
jgi:hypothetical protein